MRSVKTSGPTMIYSRHRRCEISCPGDCMLLAVLVPDESTNHHQHHHQQILDYQLQPAVGLSSPTQTNHRLHMPHTGGDSVCECGRLKGTSTLKNIPRKTNIYVKLSSTLVIKLTMSSLERRFLTIKITTVVQPVLQGD